MTIRVNYNYQKERSRLELEKLAIKTNDKKNRELVSKSNFIIQRNDYLKKLKKKLKFKTIKKRPLKIVKGIKYGHFLRKILSGFR